jgi:hypothetical protein
MREEIGREELALTLAESPSDGDARLVGGEEGGSGFILPAERY